MRAFERALRRAALPLRMSEGYNPRPRLSFPAPLGVGTVGCDEVMEFDLADWVPPNEITRRLKEQLPEGLELISLELASPKRHARAVSVTYRVEPGADVGEDERLSDTALKALMGRDAIWVGRRRKGRDKRVNVRPFIRALHRDGDAIVLDAAAGPEGSVRPEEVLEALGFDPADVRGRFRLTRTRVTLQE